MNKNLKIALICFCVLVVIGFIIALTAYFVQEKKIHDKFSPVITLSCADCINKCNDKYKNDLASWTQCSLDSISNPDCKCPDLETVLGKKL
jgi:hypothetical protein